MRSRLPFFLPFTFSAVAASTRNTAIINVPYDLAVYGIAISASDLLEENFYSYFIQFQNYDSGETLFDEPLQALCLQSDSRTPWLLPSKWYLRKNDRVVCNLNVVAGSTTETYYVTLLAHTADADPNPGVEPFVYAFPMNLGFQDNASDSGQTSVNFNQQISNTMAKPALFDFDLHSIVLDPAGTEAFGIPDWSFQVSTERRKFFDRMVINGVAGGGNQFGQGGSFTNPAALDAFLDNNVQQYKFPRPERICKGELMRVDIAPAPTYMASNTIHYAFNQLVCMALIGNHIA